MDLNLCISDGFAKTKIYEKRGDFDFDIVSFPSLDGVVPVRHPIVFIFLNLFDLLKCPVMLVTFNTNNGVLTAKLLNKDIDIINFVWHVQSFIRCSLT